jgi:signal transduction histidine kinase
VALMDLPEVIEQAADDAAAALRNRGVRCVIDGPRPMHVTADALLIGQVALNLLLNAAEAMEDGGTIAVHFMLPPPESDAKQFHLIVRDGGPGIPPHALDRIFNPFFTTKDTGTGLGLAIVHRIVEAHDGSIVATNMDGGGAKFEIRI